MIRVLRADLLRMLVSEFFCFEFLVNVKRALQNDCYIFYDFWAKPFWYPPVTTIGDAGCDQLHSSVSKFFAFLIEGAPSRLESKAKIEVGKKMFHPIFRTNNHSLECERSVPQMIPHSMKSSQFQRVNFRRSLF